MRLLIVEDEQDLCRTMAQVLRSDGYEVDACGDGGTALELATVESYDLILLDLNLPVMDGMEVLRRLRMENAEVKILILSARTELQDKVDGLDFGANDYLTKPFHFAELEARIRSLTRRRFVQEDTVLSCGGISFDTVSRTATADGPQGGGAAGISSAPSGTCGERGGIDGAPMGWKCEQLQQCGPCPHLSTPQKTPVGPGV